MICLECKGVASDSNWKFCCIQCRNKAISRLPRGTGKRNHMICRECGSRYSVKASQVKRSKYCSKKCQGKAFGKKIAAR